MVGQGIVQTLVEGQGLPRKKNRPVFHLDVSRITAWIGVSVVDLWSKSVPPLVI